MAREPGPQLLQPGLRLFLQELPEPVIPTGLQTRILHLYQEYSSEEELARNMKYFLQQLPQVNYSLLRFLCRFLSSVASLQEESWSVGALAAVFGPDIFHLDTDVEDLKEQESVSRILAELLENQEDFFDTEEDDISTTNDYSSINEQITELLEDEKLEACEELPQDGEDGPSSISPKHTHVTPSSSSHISSISILPGSADILQRTIRAAVEQHLLDLQSSIDQGLNSFESQSSSCQTDQGDWAGEKMTRSEEREDDQVEASTATDADQPAEDNEAFQCSQLSLVGEESSRMDLDAENNIKTTARRDTYSECEYMDQTDVTASESAPDVCDLNANTETAEQPGQEATTGHIQLSSVFSDGEWEDPVPVFMSWQEESESGEAQLSPLAGRMLPLPLEEDAQPLLARRFLDFGHSQRFLHQDPDATSPTKALSYGRPRRASCGSKESVKGDSISQQLTKKLQNLKKKIKQFEEQFEKDKNYMPSHADKAANPKVLKWMTDLTKIRKQLKDSKHRADSELTPQTRPRSNTLPKSFGSTLEHSALEGSAEKESEARGLRPTHEDTLELIQRCIKSKREEDGWPEDIRKMTKEQLACEKTVLQKNLLYYEGLHGRPGTREERLIVKPLYDRYRLVKQMLTRVSITPIIASPSSKRRNQTLQPIIEGETAHFCEEIKEEDEEEDGGGDLEIRGMQIEGSDVIIALDPAARLSPQHLQPENILRAKMEESSCKLTLDLRLSSSNSTSMNVQKEDRLPMMDEYKEYKRIKAKLRLLEVLISKQDSSKSI
ncbi:hypothetical protein NFI96_001172 [Prochilodus magdalenae]|nr:hypothetical protein NFI96_001172 [Prochilodus magdalenae]